MVPTQRRTPFCELRAYESRLPGSFLHAGFRFKMKPQKYTAKQIGGHRSRYCSADALASVCRGTTRIALDRYKLNGRRAPCWIQLRPGRTARAVMLDVKSVMAAYF